jgi:hypothetical protein
LLYPGVQGGAGLQACDGLEINWALAPEAQLSGMIYNNSCQYMAVFTAVAKARLFAALPQALRPAPPRQGYDFKGHKGLLYTIVRIDNST